MKLKYKFVIRDIGGSAVAAAVGKDGAEFRGMIKLNDSGKVIFESLFEDTTCEEIAEKLVSEYGISKDDALMDVTRFTDGLREKALIVD